MFLKSPFTAALAWELSVSVTWLPLLKTVDCKSSWEQEEKCRVHPNMMCFSNLRMPELNARGIWSLKGKEDKLNFTTNFNKRQQDLLVFRNDSTKYSTEHVCADSDSEPKTSAPLRVQVARCVSISYNTCPTHSLNSQKKCLESPISYAFSTAFWNSSMRVIRFGHVIFVRNYV